MGPVLNKVGKVIGVSVATFRGGQNLNFAIPSNYLKALVAQVGPAKPFLREKTARSRRSILADLGGRSTDGVTGGKLTWNYAYSQEGDYAFSLQNRLRKNVRNVSCLVVFYDAQGDPIDVDVCAVSGTDTRWDLARRVESNVHSSVQELTTRSGSKTPHAKVELRILDFEIVE